MGIFDALLAIYTLNVYNLPQENYMPQVPMENNSHISIRIPAEEQVNLSERDGLRIMALLENPPAPNARLRAAARALAKTK